MEQWEKDIVDLKNALNELKNQTQRFSLSFPEVYPKWLADIHIAALQDQVSFVNFSLSGYDMEYKPFSVKTETK